MTEKSINDLRASMAQAATTGAVTEPTEEDERMRVGLAAHELSITCFPAFIDAYNAVAARGGSVDELIDVWGCAAANLIASLGNNAELRTGHRAARDAFFARFRVQMNAHLTEGPDLVSEVKRDGTSRPIAQ